MRGRLFPESCEDFSYLGLRQMLSQIAYTYPSDYFTTSKRKKNPGKQTTGKIDSAYVICLEKWHAFPWHHMTTTFSHNTCYKLVIFDLPAFPHLPLSLPIKNYIHCVEVCLTTCYASQTQHRLSWSVFGITWVLYT